MMGLGGWMDCWYIKMRVLMEECSSRLGNLVLVLGVLCALCSWLGG